MSFQISTKTRFIKKPVDRKAFLTELRMVGEDVGIREAMEAISKSFFCRELVCKLRSLVQSKIHFVTVAPLSIL